MGGSTPAPEDRWWLTQTWTERLRTESDLFPSEAAGTDGPWTSLAGTDAMAGALGMGPRPNAAADGPRADEISTFQLMAGTEERSNEDTCVCADGRTHAAVRPSTRVRACASPESTLSTFLVWQPNWEARQEVDRRWPGIQNGLREALFSQVGG